MNREIACAYKILSKIYFDGAFSSIEMNSFLETVRDDINAGMITKIVYGVMEKDVTLNYIINQFAVTKPDKEILLILKIGTYINREVKSIPDFAMVNELVNLTKQVSKFSSGFVNAILKNIVSKKVFLPSKDKYSYYLSIKYSFPLWFVEKLIKQNGVEFTEKLLSYDMTSLTHIRIRKDVDFFKNKLNENLIKFVPSLFDYTIYVDFAKLNKVQSLKGYYIIQGLPSIIACNTLMCDKTDNSLVLDLCSSPGGKTCFIAENYDCKLLSCDIYDYRLDLVKKYVKNLNLENVQFLINDGTIENENLKEKFDYVLADVPCSNLGLIRKKPDVLLNRSLQDTISLPNIQYKILENAGKYVKKGGYIVYSTCTILNEENGDVVNKFIKNYNFSVEKLDLDNIGAIEKDNMYTFYSHLTNTEGFFIARLKKL